MKTIANLWKKMINLLGVNKNPQTGKKILMVFIIGTIFDVLLCGCGLFLITGPTVHEDNHQSKSVVSDCIKWINELHLFNKDKKVEKKTKIEPLEKVTALGRLEPYGEVTRLSLPGFLRDARVDKIYVHEGEKVNQGQIICTLDSTRRLQADLGAARQKVSIARAQFAKVKAGEKPATLSAQEHRIKTIESNRQHRINSQKAAVLRLEAALQFAANEFKRYDNLYNTGAISASMRDQKKTELSRARANLTEACAELKRIDQSMIEEIATARSDLKRLSNVRQVDVDIARQELMYASVNLDKIKTDLEMSTVRAPKSGRILNLLVREGETVSSKGIAEIGMTSQMVAVAEVYQTDIARVRPGQRATITGDGFNGNLLGTVWQIGWKVEKQGIASDSPDSPLDRRVIEVKVLIDKKSCDAIKGLTDMEVDVAIDTKGNSVEFEQKKL